LLSDKKCIACHAVGGQGGHVGPDLKKWAAYRNPVSWVQVMWNHAPAMERAMSGRGIHWPEFQGNDVADMIAYVRKLAPGARGRVYLRAADPAAGRRTFQDKGCARCHAIRGAGGRQAPDLGGRGMPRTLGQFAGLMWNHGPTMWANMKAQGISRPQFSDKEMADLIAYLFAERYFEAAGNADRGRRVFDDKGCSSCHAVGGGKGVAPDLGKWRNTASTIPLATALWNHGPLMFQTMREQQITWPRFAPGEMVDVLEYLNRVPAKPLQEARKQK
jgi:mono/diheme cytochrome c family protein